MCTVMQYILTGALNLPVSGNKTLDQNAINFKISPLDFATCGVGKIYLFHMAMIISKFAYHFSICK